MQRARPKSKRVAPDYSQAACLQALGAAASVGTVFVIAPPVARPDRDLEGIVVAFHAQSDRRAGRTAFPQLAIEVGDIVQHLVVEGMENVATLQAGAGIVADSDPAEEHRECLRKIAALQRAVDLADAGGYGR